MRSVDENKAALLELGSSPAMWRMLETMALAGSGRIEYVAYP